MSPSHFLFPSVWKGRSVPQGLRCRRPVNSALPFPDAQLQLSEIQTLKSRPSTQCAVVDANESHDLAVLTPAEAP